VSRSGPHLLTALGSPGGPHLGVDVESVAAVRRGWRDDLVLAAGEPGPQNEAARAALWAAKEAVLKMLGTGLARPMTDIRTADHHVRAVPAPEGYRAAVCLGVRAAGAECAR
jgi:4'-phosphopantetheinyl transferase